MTPRVDKIPSERQCDTIDALCRHYGADVHGGAGWSWGESPSKIRARLGALVRMGLADEREGFWTATDRARLAWSLARWGRSIVGFARAVRDDERTRAEARTRREALVARCESWLDSKNDGFGRPAITASELADFMSRRS